VAGCCRNEWPDAPEYAGRDAKLANDGIFVFGSNLKGIHGKGAALTARQNYGAKIGVAEGLHGWSYALPTKDSPQEIMHLSEVRIYVGRFVQEARNHPELNFKVTQVGCNLAGHTKEDIAPMFLGSPRNCFFDTAWAPMLGDGYRYWGKA